jgi:hypothetical protein
MELDCSRHDGFVIWISRTTDASWSYVVTPTAAHLETHGAGPTARVLGGPFRTKALALLHARERIQQHRAQAEAPRPRQG